MSTKKIMIENVSDTAIWVAYYRAKETERPDAMFRDPLAKRLVGIRGAQLDAHMAVVSRYTEWAVLSRTVIIDDFIHKLLAQEIDCVLNLGAGLDTRPYRMELPKKLHWIEVDYQKLLDSKNAILENEKPRCELTRFASDLADNSARQKLLQDIGKKFKKILVLTEGVIPYLTEAQVAALGSDLRTSGNFAFWITEYFDARVYRYLKAPLRSDRMKNARFEFFPKNWIDFFAALGWKPLEIQYSNSVAQKYNRKVPMSFIFRVIVKFLPKAQREKSSQMTGYMVFSRGSENAL